MDLLHISASYIALRPQHEGHLDMLVIMHQDCVFLKGRLNLGMIVRGETYLLKNNIVTLIPHPLRWL